jgi:putative two-component system hydrogenase maturation factor HypX/HoxX
MRILLLAHAFNSLTQRLHIELCTAGHDVSTELDVNDSVTEEAVALWRPDLVIAPFLKRRIPDSVWRRNRCIVIHPGIRGDRGPSALDWAIMNGETEWGVTALEANGEMDAGDVWAEVRFPMRAATKSSLYRNEVTEAAVEAMHTMLARLARGESPEKLDPADPSVRGRLRPVLRQTERRIDWSRDDTATVLSKIRAADGMPGVLDELRGERVHLHDAYPESELRGAPGTVIAQRAGAILCATIDGAVWITHLRRAEGAGPTFKLPAAMVLGTRLDGIRELALAPDTVVAGESWRPIRYEEADGVGYLHFPFCNGAMGTAQCEALLAAYRDARSRPTRVIALMGGPDFWSNGIDLNLIEASAHPADESWRNINAMNDLVREIVFTDRQLTIAAMQGNAGAGGVFLALAADLVWAREGAVLNPHYKSMGNLYGSEYWTYLLPRRVGPDRAGAITQHRMPVGTREAVAVGLIDAAFGGSPTMFCADVRQRAQAFAADPALGSRLEQKRARRQADETAKPLAAYRDEELERMRLNFYGFDSSYHVARHHFVAKVPRSRTPLWLARHRALAPGRKAA